MCLTIARPRPVPPSGAAAAGVGAIEALGQPRQMFRRDAIAFVADIEQQPAGFRGFDGNRHRAARLAIFHCIIDQVADHLPQLAAIAANEDPISRAADLHTGGIANFARDLAHQGDHIDRIGGNGMLDRLDPRQRHQILDQRLHALRLALDDAEKALAGRKVVAGLGIGQGFDIAEDRRQRRAQFMAGIGDKIGVRARHADLDRGVLQGDQPGAVIEHVAGQIPDAAGG